MVQRAVNKTMRSREPLMYPVLPVTGLILRD